MANPGSGNRFVSVNLNKSYGKSNSLGVGRVHPSGHGLSGMGVLSRARSVISSGQKGPRLSVPPPLNLPSRRKEQEKIDPSSGSLIGASSVPGLGSGSSGIGWTKPHSSRIGEGEVKIPSIVPSVSSASREDGENTRVTIYMPPGSRSIGVEPPIQVVEKAVLLRGEDFPSLRASMPVAPSPLRQKEQQKQNQTQGGVEMKGKGSKHSDGVLDSSFTLYMRPQMKPRGNFAEENDGLVVSSEKRRKDDGVLSDLLPVVRLVHFDWADDERDTSYRPERQRDHSPSRKERETELILSHKNTMHRSGNDGVFDTFSFQKNDSPKAFDVYGRQFPGNTNGKNENSWRGFPVRKDVHGTKDVGLKQNFGAVIGSTSLNNATTTATGDKLGRVTYTRNSLAKDDAWDGPAVSVSRPHQDSYAQMSQKGINSMEMVDGRCREQSFVSRQVNCTNWTRGSAGDIQNTISRSPFSSGAKGFPVKDQIRSFGKDTGNPFSFNGKPHSEGGFVKDLANSTLDGRNPFALDVRLVKKKKDLLKNVEFPDPARETFEAELERVQKMQELERQRILDEQARAAELARKEEEERERLAREEAERRRQLEEEAREAAWRAEQERLEASERAKAQRRAREEEKRQMLLEEERRKEAARQKLLELEARIARRQTEGSGDEILMRPVGDSTHGSLKGREHSRTVAESLWEESERAVVPCASSSSSESSNPIHGNAVGHDQSKIARSWKRDDRDVGSTSATFIQRNNYDDVIPGGGFSRREFHGGPDNMSNRGKIGSSDLLVNDDTSRVKVQRWNYSRDDQYNRRLDVDGVFAENTLDRFEGLGWQQDRAHVASHVLDAERLFQNTEIDGLSSGRSRHFVRQPRVLPPPSLSSFRSSSRVNVGQSTSSSFVHGESKFFVDGESKLQHPLHEDVEFPASDYGSRHHENQEQSDLVSVPQESQSRNGNEDELGCDSQSSLSVSSMPNSPTHISHDDIEDSADSDALNTDYEQIVMSDSNNVMPRGTENKVTGACRTSASPEEEKEQWTVKGNVGSGEQEVYDEEEASYQEDDEVHEGDDEHFDLANDFRGLRLEQQVQTPMLQQDYDLDSVVKARAIKGNDFVETRIGVRTTKGIDLPKNNLSELQNSVSIEETAKAFQDLVPQHVMDSSSGKVSTTKHVDDIIESSESVLSVKPTHASVVGSPSSCQQAQPVLDGVSSVPRQAELNIPVKFGLFSGPTLVPSPLPAIQIGSIQMPLQLHPQVGQPPLHPSQPSIFQFGQISCPSPLTQGILPIPQTLSCVQSTLPSCYVNQKSTVSLPGQSGQEPPRDSDLTRKGPTNHLECKQGLTQTLMDLRKENLTHEITSLPMIHDVGSVGDKVPNLNSFFSGNCAGSEFMINAGDRINKNAVTKKSHMINDKESQDLIVGEHYSSTACPSKPASNRVWDGRPSYGTRGGRVVYRLRNAGPEPPFLVSEASHVEANTFRRKSQRVVHRTEFRVRGECDKRKTEVSDPHGSSGKEMVVPNVTVDSITSKRRGRKNVGVHKDTREPLRPDSRSAVRTSYLATKSEGKREKTLGSDMSTKRQTSSDKNQHLPDRNLKKNIVAEEDVDTSLQSGVVRIFNQPGIEAPSDDDDFIEVRSKRQVLNDRRELREKEIKERSRSAKGSRKPHGHTKTAAKSSNFVKTHASFAADGGSLTSNAMRGQLCTPDGQHPNQKNVELSSPFGSDVTSQSLPPIDAPAAHTDIQADNRHLSMRPLRDSSFPVVHGHRQNLVPGSSFQNNTGAVDNVSGSLGSWDDGHNNVVVRVDEAVKSANFGAQFSPPLQHSDSVKDIGHKPKVQDKSFSASANSLNSLLAGEKIQFGAVTFPTILPPGSCGAFQAVGPVVACMSKMHIEHKLPAPEGDCMTFFDKAKRSEGSPHEVHEPEAEVAASATAVATFSHYEPIGNGLASGSLSVPDVKNCSGCDTAIPTETLASTVPMSSQSRSEESFSISLPADLSVETPAPSLWPLPSNSQCSSSTMQSRFQGLTHSGFPFFEVNPMLGSSILTLDPHEESTNDQPQGHKNNNVSGSGSVGPWQHHSGIDSVYGPPAGLAGPFVRAPGAFPGIHGPPHMVVYNPFAPVGHFGQMGLRLMGTTTYIPSGKQPDWKHIPVSSSSSGLHNGSMNNLNLVAGQCEPSMPMPIQPLAPGSSLLPITPLGLFDASPFQTSPDLAAQTFWGHIPASSLHSLPLSAGDSTPLQQTEVPQQFNVTNVESSGIRFGEGLPLKPIADGYHTLTMNDATSQFPNELELQNASSGNGSVSILSSGASSYSGTNVKEQNGSKISSTTAGKVGNDANIIGNGNIGGAADHGNQSSISNFVSRAPSPQSSYLNEVGYTEQKDRGSTPKVGPSGGWLRSHGFSGRSRAGVAGKNLNTAKMKQIYVAKPASSRSASNSDQMKL